MFCGGLIKRKQSSSHPLLSAKRRKMLPGCTKREGRKCGPYPWASPIGAHRLAGSGESATATLSIGEEHVVSIVATDANGMEDRVFQVVTPTDTLGPEVTLASPLSLWPPNHKYATITLDDCVQSIVDQCDGALLAQARITAVTSEELEVAPGSGNTTDDVVIVGDQTVKLRGERNGRGDGREYSIEFTVADSQGNTTDATCIVEVGHSR